MPAGPKGNEANVPPLPEVEGGLAKDEVVLFEEAAERQPPNHFDLRIWRCDPRRLPLRPAEQVAPLTDRHDVPGVPGAFLLRGLLDSSEARAIIDNAERLGFEPHHPVGRPAPTGIDACEWLIDEPSMRNLFARVSRHIPDTVEPLASTKSARQGARAVGINMRWRLFRYSAGSRYRPHIDGSWPASGIDPKTGKYAHDAFPDRRSRLTFLVYLNDDFEGGHTTYYLPSTTRARGLDVHRVRPVQGGAMCFQQASTASLVHEGAPVVKGTKYVVRTDVMYQVG